MVQTAQRASSTTSSLQLPDLLELCERALGAAEGYAALAKASVARLVLSSGAIDAARLDGEQRAAHGFAWLTTYVTALRETLGWARRLQAGGKLGEIEALICQAAFGEYLAQIAGGIAMSQGEIVRAADFGLNDEAHTFAADTAVGTLTRRGASSAVLMRIAALIAEGAFGDSSLEDEALLMVREQFRRFAEEHRDAAHEWHKQDAFIPLAVIEELAGLGVFGLTVPEEFGGAGLGKLAMCIVTEELSRGYLGLGSLGTRSEIAAELIRLGGTDAQKQKWLPKLASGEILPTAVFTEPSTGSDLGSLRTRAVRDGETYRITGNKTWITHAARADVMTLLARTDANEPGYKGLSMFLAEKPRGTDSDPFPVDGLRGGEIRVLGYRGMKEYELAFDGFAVKAENLLGGVEGQGFKQLMATFESARVQTAARAVGVAQNALELGLAYAKGRVQFGKPIVAFPRVAGKLAWMAAETMVARQLTWFAARQKDSGKRCDIEAGMAKLLAARVAWANADNALQVHGGNGYAEEYAISRVLCDARILNIFEGAAEIQAQVIARGLLSGRN
ncbi:MAG TPA: acyl-CoA dehydrogenase family protein [Candidatus Acidoferrum sp.]|nr:acyl-CoA dehydrogenase family protein [Candidatus Acidoferrum sp.]